MSVERTSAAAPSGDQPARDRIVSDLSTNMLVEAGAGSGKTTSLVARMVSLVESGTPVEEIAAVTFTRKAANELRERFQLKLEQRAGESQEGSVAAQRFHRALRELDRAFLGTIHSFCARLLREHPLEIALDPNFVEVTEENWDELVSSFWHRWVERKRHEQDAEFLELQRVGVDPFTLADGFCTVIDYPDVEFPLGNSKEPDASSCKRALDAALARAQELMPKVKPAQGWDNLMRLVYRLGRHRQQNDEWTSVMAFCEVLERITESNLKLTQKLWSTTTEGKAAAKQLGDDLRALLDGPIADLLRCWREHRYPIVMRVLQRAAVDFERERHATGQLGFSDLLLLAAKLLREHPAVRDELGARYRRLLVDEFQDTDPIQAEVCFLLASPSESGNDWRSVSLRSGGLFVVGDPKQSIYRFRRADIQIYELVKRHIEDKGAILALTQNFRSVNAIGNVVNRYFGGVFPSEATPMQASFSPLQTNAESVEGDGAYHYTIAPEENNKGSVISQDAERIASWISERIERGERRAGDFLILTFDKAPIESYARALGERNVPFSTSGASLPQEYELSELLVVLRAIADPENAISVVAALEGLFFGLTPAALYDAREAGIGFSITHRPGNEEHPVGRALGVLHDWWIMSQRHSADVLIEHILDTTGLLYHAASQPLGDARAGALLHLVEDLRASSSMGASAITDAMDRLAVVLNAEAADAPLRPGRLDSVRVMNLHKAKGLEAEVVILASPVDAKVWPATVHIKRDATDRPTGGLVVQLKEFEGGGDPRIIAQPPGWAAMQEEEGEFLAAERMRLLYVATTRAKRELVVSRSQFAFKDHSTPDQSLWRPLAETLDTVGTQLALPLIEASGRRRLERAGASIQEATAEAARRRQEASTAGLRAITVTESAKSERETMRAYDLPRGGAGVGWGRAVHRSLEAMGRGRSGENLRWFVAAVAGDEGLSEDQQESLEKLLGETAQSEAWKGLLEHGMPYFELSVMRNVREGDVEVLTQGVIDVAAMNGSEWLVVDWKSDSVDDATWRARETHYRRQVGSYAEMLSSLTGLPVRASVERVWRQI